MSGGPGTGMGIAVTTVTTNAQAPLGFIHTEPASLSQGLTAQGEKTWIYVKASGSALAAGDVCIRQPGSQNYGDLVVGPTANGVIISSGAVAVDRVVGVAQHAIPDGSFGFIQRSGIGNATDNGTLAVDDGITPAAAGDAATAGVGVGSFGLALTAPGAGLIAVCLLNCDG